MRQCGIGDSRIGLIACRTLTRLAEIRWPEWRRGSPCGRRSAWFWASAAAYIHDPLRMIIIGEQGRDRQHRTGLLNVKQALKCSAVLPSGNILFIALDQNRFMTPRNWRERPAVKGARLEPKEISHGDFKRVDAYTAAQRGVGRPK